MKKVLKTKNRFKRTLAFCVIMAIFATVLHLNGAKADDKEVIEKDPVFATVQLGTKTDAGTPITVTFNKREEPFDTTKDWVQDWINSGWTINGNQLTKTFTDSQHTELLIYYYNVVENDTTVDYYPEVAKIAIPYELDISSSIPVALGNASDDYTIADETIVKIEERDGGTKYFKPLSVGTTTMTGNIWGYDFEWTITVTDSGNTETPEETTVFATVDPITKTSSGYPVKVTFNTVDEIDTTLEDVQRWISNGWNINGNVATKTYAEGEARSATLTYKTIKTENDVRVTTNEIAKIAIPYYLDVASNTYHGVSSNTSSLVIADTTVATFITEDGSQFIKPLKAGNTTMSGKYKDYDFVWPIYVTDSSNPGTDPGDEPGTNPGDEPGTNPGDEPGTNPSDEPGTNPSDEPGTNPGDEPGTNPGDEPGTNPSDEPGTNPSDEPGTNPSDEPGTNPSDNSGNNNSNSGSSSDNNKNSNPSNSGIETGTSVTDNAKVKEDYTVATKNLSKTGENYLYVFVMIGLVLIAIRAYIKDLKERKK